jgi:dynein heavy chain
MRAVKSVLVMAGALKRAEPDLNEDIVLVRAMRDSNIPKFLPDDLPLFSALIQDLFPGLSIPDTDYGELDTAIRHAIDVSGLQQVPGFITKVVQLYDTFLVRFGVMIVGPSGAGQSPIHACSMLMSMCGEEAALLHARRQVCVQVYDRSWVVRQRH